MPWRNKMSEREQFIERLKRGERMTDLCREFGICRSTGYTLWKRYQEEGLQGLLDRSRRPYNSPNQTPKEMVDLIVFLRIERPTWGPKKLHWLLSETYPGVKIPAISTIALILRREGLTQKPKRPRRKAIPTQGPLTQAQAPNDVWAIDFKGQFRLGNRTLCYPLTVTDCFSRAILLCEALESTKGEEVKRCLQRVFQEKGLPKVIRSDNGTPFASTGLCGLSALSVWLLRQGIQCERIEPGHPEQNGQHERMHRVLKAEATRPAQHTLLSQQEVFERFQREYNEERPHESIGMIPPSRLYESSPRAFQHPLPALDYPFHEETGRVKKNGQVYFRPLQKYIHIGEAFREQTIGFRWLEEGCWLVNFMHYELGYIDQQSQQFLTKGQLECV